MKTLIPIIITLGLLSGCATQKRCFEKFADTVLTDTTYFRDTTYIVYFEPSDTVYKYGYIRDTVYASSGLAGGSAWTSNDTLFLKVWQTDTIIEYRDSIKFVEREVVHTIEVPCPKPKVMNKIIALAVIVLLILLVAKIKF